VGAGDVHGVHGVQPLVGYFVNKIVCISLGRIVDEAVKATANEQTLTCLCWLINSVNICREINCFYTAIGMHWTPATWTPLSSLDFLSINTSSLPVHTQPALPSIYSISIE